MKISTRSRYGMRAMVNLARHHRKGPLLLKEIAENEGISLKYLDHILQPLQSRGLIRRVREGYILSRPPEKFRCYEIIKVLEGTLVSMDCVENPPACEKSERCATLNLWKVVRESIIETLQSITLEDLAFSPEKLQKRGAPRGA